MQTILKLLTSVMFLWILLSFNPISTPPLTVATPLPLNSVYLPLVVNQSSDITVTLLYYSNEQFGNYHQENYTFILEASSIISRTEGEFILGIKNDFQKQKSSLTFGTGAKLTTLTQMNQIVKLQETAIQLVHQYAKFELE